MSHPRYVIPSLFYLHIKILKALAYTKTIFQIGIFNTPQPSGGLLQPFPVSTKDNSSRKKTKGQVERPGKYQHIWHIAFISMYHTLRIMYTFCVHTPIVHILCTHTLCTCRQRNATSGTELDPLDPLVAGIAIYHHDNDNDGHRRYSSFAEVVIIQICHYCTEHV